MGSILEEAQAAVYGPRQKAYGHPRDDFARICRLWGAYLRGVGVLTEPGLTPVDVSCMMVLLKMARLMESPGHRDSWVDMAGYAATGARAVGVDE